MRDLTSDEIREYLQFAHSDLSAADFHQDQAQLIGNALVEEGFIKAIQTKLGKGLKAGMSINDAFLSLWVMAFQMERECESRLITIALKHGHR